MQPNSSRSVFITIMLMAVFAFSAVLTVPVSADDDTPPPTETPAEVTPPVDASTPAAADQEPVAEETTPAEETVAELLTQVPEGTEVVAVNDEGETIPLAAQEASAMIEAVDPVWCPTGVAPKTDGTGGCTTSYGSLKELTDALMAGAAGVVPTKAGVIWIEDGADASAGAILLNGNDPQLGTMETFSLTLQGGWNGVHGSSSVSLLTPSTFTKSLSIINWLGDITLNNLTFSSVTVGSASNNAALNIQTSKKITLKNVNVKTNTGAGTVNGAWLDNEDGAPLVFGDVSITNSTFNDNKNVGLTVNSEGAITLANVLVNGNDAGGAVLNNTFAAAAKAVTITTGTNEFNNNKGIGNGDGLYILSNGAITLKDITANDNGGNGAIVDNHLAATAQPVTLTGTNIFSENTNFGLRVDSLGVISASNLIAYGNANSNPLEWGVYLKNIYSPVAQAVKLTGNNEFKFNGNGLFIWSKGAITTNNIVATDSTLGRGAALWNNLTGFSSSVTMTGVNIFTDNAYGGLEIYSKGSIILNNIKATGNGFSSSIIACTYEHDACGAYLDNSQSLTPMAVTLNGTNTFNNNFMTGLEIHSNGVVTLNKVTANDNINGYGALIHNELVALPKAVTLNGFGVFNNNLSGGLRIITKGSITLNNVTANENHNSANTVGGNGVLLDNIASTSALPQNITLNGTNQFNGNYVSGLNVNTYGVVLLSKVTASDNVTGYGALIHNELAALPKAVTLSGYGVFNNNSLGGLYIYSKGAITLNNVTANENHNSANIADRGTGVLLDNTASTPALPQNVTIHGTNTFNGNFIDGLSVRTYGAILTNNLTANDNIEGYGASLVNDFGTTPKAVTLNGVNEFNGNTGSGSGGLIIFSLGIITVNKLEASNNNGYGARLENNGAAVPVAVNITGWVYTDNDDIGLYIRSKGAITIANLNINNGSNNYGVWLDTSSSVTLSGTSQIFYSGDGTSNAWGLYITAVGSVTLSNMTVSGNDGDGVYIESGQNVTLKGFNTFWDNMGNGLTIVTYGAISISNIDAYNNGQAGVYLDNCGALNNSHQCDPGLALAPKGITLTGSNFFEKNGSVASSLVRKNGLFAVSFGAISISNIHSTDNAGNGAHLNNQWGPGSLGGITLTGINSFENNGASGLVALSNGAIGMSNLTADSNGADGVSLDNESIVDTKAVAVTLIGVNTFTNNGDPGPGEGSGLVIYAGGQITLSNVTASGNKASGAILDNVTTTSLLIVKPGVKLTGLNIFNRNVTNDGLNILSAGAVDLGHITADDNGVDGVYVLTTATIVIACGSMNDNSNNGWDLTGSLITLKGVFGFGIGNTNVNITSVSPVVSRACPVPPPVVIPPKDKSDDEPHGSKSERRCYRARDGQMVCEEQ